MANSFSLSNAGALPPQYNNPSYNNLVSGIKVSPMGSTPQPTNSGLVSVGSGQAATGTPIKTSGFLPSTPVKSITGADGTTTTFHAPATGAKTPTYTPPAGYINVGTAQAPILQPIGGQANSQTTPVTASTNQPAPQSSPQSNPNVTQTADAQGNPVSGNTTTLQSAANAVNAARQPTADEAYYNNMAVTGQELKNINQLGQFAEAPLYGGQGEQLTPDTAAPDLEGRAGGTNALASQLGNIFGSAAQQGETNAIAQQQQNLQGAEALLTSAAPTGNIINVNPYTGLPVAGGSLGDLAQTAGTISGIQSGAATQAAAGGNIAAQNAIQSGTSSTQTSAQGYAQSLPQYVSGSTAFSTASNQANNLLNTMNALGINSSNAQDWNTAFNAAGSKLGSTKLPAFTATLAEAQQAYTNLLSSVGAATPTVNGEQALSIFNPSSTPKQIAQAVDALNQAAYAKLAPQYQQALNYYNNLHGTNLTEIPGNPPPTLPKSVSTNSPQGADLSAGNILKEGAIAAGEGVLSLGKTILSHITTLIPGLIP